MQIVSDLHLEFYKNPLDLKLKVSAPYLALLGDICVAGTAVDIKNIEAWLDVYAPKYKLVFWISGNHEYYTSKKTPFTIEEINVRIKLLIKKYGNVVFLNNKHYDIEIEGKQFRIVGTTLWAYIPDEKHKYALDNLNDYQHIFTQGEGHSGLITYEKAQRIKPIDVNLMHTKAAKYIYRHIRESNIPLIIFTHHKPFLSDEKDPTRASSKYAADKDPTGYESDQITKLSENERKKIAIWCYGHTHKHFDGIIDGVRFLSNPKGYPCQQTKFENNLVINKL